MASPFSQIFLRRRVQNLVLYLEAVLDRSFGPEWNPLRQMGTLSFFFFWVAAASGIYVYILFETSVGDAYQSVEAMTHQRWYLSGIIRSLHRYSSDLMVLSAALHLTREFIFDRYRDVRWFTWFTGVPIIWFLFISGISGYWLVWDKLAQYVAIGSMEWLDWLGIFGDAVASNFLTPDSLTDRFFTLLVFMHIFAPLFLLFIMWIHVIRVARPKVNPPRGLALGALAMLVGLSLVKPATSHGPADLSVVPVDLNLDWFFMMLYPVFDAWGAGTLWALAIGVSVIVAALPWIPPLRRPKPAQVYLEKCNGCSRCFEDCPFGAITMAPRSDGLPFQFEAVVDPSLCTSCGICVGACPVSTPFRTTEELITGIDLPDQNLKLVRKNTNKVIEQAGEKGIVVFGCDYGANVKSIETEGVAGLSLPCIGMLPPSFIDFTLGRNIAGVVITGCRECDCFSRLGNRWMEERIDGLRDPYLRKRVERDRLDVFWASRVDSKELAAEIEAFKTSLKKLEKAEDNTNSQKV